MNLVESSNSSNTLGFNSGFTYTQDSSDLMFDLIDMLPNPAIQHRNHFRGKFLGSRVTADQISSIRNGTFKDIWTGDYWTDYLGTNWRVADINYYWHRSALPTTLNNGDPNYFKTNHVLVMPDEILFKLTTESNLTQPLTNGGVANQPWLREVDSKGTTHASRFAEDSYVIEVPRLLPSAMGSDGFFTNKAILMKKIIVPTEAMITGSNYFAPQQPGDKAVVANHSYEQWQLKLFKLGGMKYISTTKNEDYMTSDGFSTSPQFAAYSLHGHIFSGELSKLLPINIRPLVALG